MITTKEPSDRVLNLLSQNKSETRIAVMGASNNTEKYGNIIVNNLKGKGYTLLPVNPKEKEIAGLPVFPNSLQLPDPVHIVNFVTPPKVTMAILKKLDPQRFTLLWFQEGSFDDEIISYGTDKFKEVVHEACIMVIAARY